MAAWLGAAAAAAAAAIAVAVLRGDDDGVTRAEAARVGTTALRAIGGGEVISVARSTEGDAAWRVDVTQGSQVIHVSLDDRLRQTGSVAEPLDGQRPDPQLAGIREQLDYRRGVREELREDRELPRVKRRRAAAEARRAIGGGEVVYVEESEDVGEAYEVDLEKGSVQFEVYLDRNFEPVRRVRFR